MYTHRLVAFAFVASLLLAVPLASAHAEDFYLQHEEQTIDEYLLEMSIVFIVGASLIIAIATIYAIFVHKRKTETVKWLLFLAIVVPTIITTVFISASTIYINIISESGGPVHWHADFEIWRCGEKQNLLDPTGLENRIGSPLYHEHNDDRLHVEGVAVKREQITLPRFFGLVGGFLDKSSLVMPTNDGTIEVHNGDRCGEVEGSLQFFVYRVTNPDDLKDWEYVQFKIDDPLEYEIAPFSTVPPGDCLIIEFDGEKEETDKICETMKIAIKKGELREAAENGG